MTKRKTILCVTLTAVFVMAAVWLLGRLCMPKYASGVLEGAMTQEYYDETQPHDVIFIGDCEVYENFSPVTMWEEAGITSYIRGSAQQLIWQSYWLLEETFSIEKPKYVVYNVQAMKYSEPQSEAYNRMTLDGMRLSRYKLAAIRASMTEDEELVSYLIPLLRYHDRITELTSDDFRCLFGKEHATIAGYLMRTDVKPMTRRLTAGIPDTETFSDICWDYLDQIRELCEKNGAQLILIKSPSIWPAWYDEWDEQISVYAEEYGLSYINFLTVEDEIGIDWETDTYDAGLHLNVYGAEKASRWFADVLKDEYGAEDHRSDTDIAADWERKTSDYEALKAAQLEELEKYGYLKSWTLGSEEERN